MSRAGLVDYYLEKSKEEGFEIDQIRKELELKGVPEEEIRTITLLVDNDIQRRMITKDTNQRINQSQILGVAVLLIGLVIVVLTGSIWIGAITSAGGGGLLLYGRRS